MNIAHGYPQAGSRPDEAPRVGPEPRLHGQFLLRAQVCPADTAGQDRCCNGCGRRYRC